MNMKKRNVIFKVKMQLLNDIKDNEQKINHHGKRADAIVKGMLAAFKSKHRQKRTNRYQCIG